MVKCFRKLGMVEKLRNRLTLVEISQKDSVYTPRLHVEDQSKKTVFLVFTAERFY